MRGRFRAVPRPSVPLCPAVLAGAPRAGQRVLEGSGACGGAAPFRLRCPRWAVFSAPLLGNLAPRATVAGLSSRPLPRVQRAWRQGSAPPLSPSSCPGSSRGQCCCPPPSADPLPHRSGGAASRTPVLARRPRPVRPTGAAAFCLLLELFASSSTKGEGSVKGVWCHLPFWALHSGFIPES